MGVTSPFRKRINAALKLSAVVYRPENIVRLTSIIDRLRAKLCLSATDDDLATMKTYLLTALKQGMVENTVVTALAEGPSIVGL